MRRRGGVRRTHPAEGALEASVKPKRGFEEMGFLEVGFEDVALVASPHYHRAPAFVMWVASPELAGIFPTAPQGLSDLDPAATFFARLGASPRFRMLYVDLRGFGAEGLVFKSLLERAPVIDDLSPVRTSVVLPEDWTRAWWVGAVEIGVTVSAPSRAFTDSAAAWAWLCAPEHLLPAVESLTATFGTAATLRTDLYARLKSDPSLTIERAAHALSSSARSLQRQLRAAGDTFADLRSRARAEIAASRLADTDDKLEVIAASAGFRSRSHFVSWFRRVTGKSPADFRQSQKPKDG